VEAVGPAVGDRGAGQLHGKEAQYQGERIHKNMRRIGKKSETAGKKTARGLNDHKNRRYPKCAGKPFFCVSAIVCGVAMRMFIIHSKYGKAISLKVQIRN